LSRGAHHCLQPRNAFGEQLPLRQQMRLRFRVAVEQRGDLIQRKTTLAIEQQLLQPLEIAPLYRR
jgi:hypothetical protein